MDGDERKKWLHKKAITSSRRSIRRERVMRQDNGGLVKRRAPPPPMQMQVQRTSLRRHLLPSAPRDVKIWVKFLKGRDWAALFAPICPLVGAFQIATAKT